MTTVRPTSAILRRIATTYLALLLLATIARPLGSGLSGNLDPFDTALSSLQGTLQPLADGGDKAAKAQIKTIGKIVKLLAKTSTSATYVGEMKAAGKAAKQVGKKLASVATLFDPLTDAAAAYRADLDVARDDFVSLIATLTDKAVPPENPVRIPRRPPHVDCSSRT